MYHNLWGMLPAFEPLTAECFTPTNSFPTILADLDQWDIENNESMRKIFDITQTRPVVGTGPVLLIDGNNVELTCGFGTFESYRDGEYHEIIKELNLKLWRSMLERVTKQGAQWYMMGYMPSQIMVEIGAYSEEYYNLMKSIKKVLDPKMILSRGKFNFWGD